MIVGHVMTSSYNHHEDASLALWALFQLHRNPVMAHFKGPADFMPYCHCLQSEEKYLGTKNLFLQADFLIFFADASLQGSSVTPENLIFKK